MHLWTLYPETSGTVVTLKSIAFSPSLPGGPVPAVDGNFTFHVAITRVGTLFSRHIREFLSSALLVHYAASLQVAAPQYPRV
jgi:hypothetical protein